MISPNDMRVRVRTIEIPEHTETVYPVKKLLHLTKGMGEAIGEYRHQQRISSGNEAIRRLIEAGLRAQNRKRPRKSDAS